MAVLAIICIAKVALLYESAANGEHTEYVYLSSQLVAKQKGNVRSYIHNDLLGSPRLETNASRVIQSNSRQQYQPYGQRIPSSNYTDIGFTGHKHDGELGLTYMQQRYYDPVIGRFYSNDPVGFTASNSMMFNRYAYANNNPYKYTDPDGKFPRNASDMARYRSMGQMQQAQQQIRQAQSHANDIMAPHDPAGVALGGVGVVGSIGAASTGIGTVPAAGGLFLSLDGIRSAWTGNRTILGVGAEHTARAMGADIHTVDAAGNAGDSITNMSGGPGAVKGIIKGTATAADAASVVSTLKEAADVIERVEIEMERDQIK